MLQYYISTKINLKTLEFGKPGKILSGQSLKQQQQLFVDQIQSFI